MNVVRKRQASIRTYFLRCTIELFDSSACKALTPAYIRRPTEEVCMGQAKLYLGTGLNVAAFCAALGLMAAIVLGAF